MAQLSDGAIEVRPLATAVRGKSEEGEGEWGDTAGDECEGAGERAGDGLDDETELARKADEAESGIADDRHAGVRHQRDRLARGDAVRKRAGLRFLGVLIEALGRLGDAEVGEELAGVACVLAKDEVRGLERLDRPRRKIAEVAEGG